MKSFLRAIIFTYFVLLAAQSVCAKSFRITAENYPPYSYEVDGHAEGFVSDIVNTLMEQLGEQQADVSFYPWARAYSNLQHGTCDVLFPMAKTPEREQLFKFVGPVFTDKVYFYRKKGSDVSIKSMEYAKNNVRIAVTRDDVYHQILVRRGFSHIDVSPNQRADFLKLLKGRVDFVPMGERAIHKFLKKYPDLDDSMFEKEGPIFFVSEAYIAFAAHVPDEVVNRWQGALDKIKESGVYQNIIDDYFEQNEN